MDTLKIPFRYGVNLSVLPTKIFKEAEPIFSICMYMRMDGILYRYIVEYVGNVLLLSLVALFCCRYSVAIFHNAQNVIKMYLDVIGISVRILN